jgi:hypothetical protein
MTWLDVELSLPNVKVWPTRSSMVSASTSLPTMNVETKFASSGRWARTFAPGVSAAA